MIKAVLILIVMLAVVALIVEAIQEYRSGRVKMVFKDKGKK